MQQRQEFKRKKSELSTDSDSEESSLEIDDSDDFDDNTGFKAKRSTVRVPSPSKDGLFSPKIQITVVLSKNSRPDVRIPSVELNPTAFRELQDFFNIAEQGFQFQVDNKSVLQAYDLLTSNRASYGELKRFVMISKSFNCQFNLNDYLHYILFHIDELPTTQAIFENCRLQNPGNLLKSVEKFCQEIMKWTQEKLAQQDSIIGRSFGAGCA